MTGLLQTKKKRFNNPIQPTFLYLLIIIIIRRIAKSPEHPVHPYRIVAVVMLVSGVMNRVVSSAHYRPELAMDAIVNVCRPYAFKEYKDYMCCEMHRNDEESYYVRYCL